MVYVGLFVAGVSFSALAALYTPKKKVKWGDEELPEVVTTVYVKRRSK